VGLEAGLALLELRLAALELERALFDLLLLLLEPLRAPLEPFGGDEALAEEIVVLALHGRSRRRSRRGSRRGNRDGRLRGDLRRRRHREDIDVRHRRLVPSAAPDTRGVVSNLVAHAAHDLSARNGTHPSDEGVRFRQRLRSCELFLDQWARVEWVEADPRGDVLAGRAGALGEQPAEESA